MAFYALNVHSEGDRRAGDKAAVFRFFLRNGHGFATGRQRSSVFRQADRRGCYRLSFSLSLSIPFSLRRRGVGEPARDAAETKISVDIFLPDARRVDRMIANVRILICSGRTGRPVLSR